MYAPAPPETVTAQLNVPALDPLGTTVHGPTGVTLAPVPIANEIVIEAPVSVVGVNPLPATVIVIPLVPWPGVSVIAGIVIVNDVCEASKLPSEPVAVTV